MLPSQTPFLILLIVSSGQLDIIKAGSETVLLTLTGVDPNSTIKDVKKKISLQSTCSFKTKFEVLLSIITPDTFDYRTRHLP